MFGKVATKTSRLGVNTHLRCLKQANSQSLRFKSTAASQDELLHFKELAPSWWDVSGSQRILHLMNLGRMDFIQRIIHEQVSVKDPEVFIPGFDYKKFVSGPIVQGISHQLHDAVNKEMSERKWKVLDIGCGGGILAESVARLPYIEHVTGIDLSPDVIGVAKEHSKLDPSLKGKVNYELKALEDIDGKFQIVTCFEMLEHVDTPADILKHAWSRLDVGGILFLSTINRDLISWFTTIFMGEQVLKIVPKGTHHLSKYINNTEILDWFVKNHKSNHQVLDTKGTMYLPAKGWVEHSNKDVGNYFMAIKKLR